MYMHGGQKGSLHCFVSKNIVKQVFKSAKTNFHEQALGTYSCYHIFPLISKFNCLVPCAPNFLKNSYAITHCLKILNVLACLKTSVYYWYI